MRTKYEYKFRTRGFRFDKEHKYHSSIRGKIQTDTREFADFQCVLSLKPDPVEPDTGDDQCGSLFVELPFAPDADVMRIASFVAQQFANKVSFQFGELKILYGGIFWERIPETPEESSHVEAEGQFGAELHLIEYVPPETYASHKILELNDKKIDTRLLLEFNAARQQTNQVAQFLGFMRVIESAVDVPRDTALAVALKNHAELKSAYAQHFTEPPFEDFVDAIVARRHKCAHLKLRQDFGLVPGDPVALDEIAPYLWPIELLARTMISSRAPTNPG